MNIFDIIEYMYILSVPTTFSACLSAGLCVLYTCGLILSMHAASPLLTHICRWWLVDSSKSEKNTDRWTIYHLHLGKDHYFHLGHTLPFFFFYCFFFV